MRTSCLISCYNYAHYLGEAVEGALKQTVPVDEIIIVDDGSTDGSAKLARERWSGMPQVRLIEKANEGQLSCFNRGFEATTADVVFFLDADDVWEKDYVEAVLHAYRDHPAADFVCAGVQFFGGADEVGYCEERDRDLGYSLLEAFYYRRWSGSPTSALSMRRGLLGRVLPLQDLSDWRIRADDCLVLGASLAGARKFHLARPLVRYRVHGGNSYYGRRGDGDAGDSYRWRLAVDRMAAHVLARTGNDPDRLALLAHREFATIERPNKRQFRRYLRILWRSRASLTRRWQGSLAIWRHHRAQRAGRLARQPTESARV